MSAGRAKVAGEVPPPPIRGRGCVISNETDGNGRKLCLEVPAWPGSRPGQFLMIGAGAEPVVPRRDPLLPRPMAVYRDHSQAVAAADTSPAAVRIEVLYRVVGRGTTLLAEASPGEWISIVGPLGQGFPIEAEGGAALLVGGGTGIASLYELASSLSQAGRRVRVLLGARGEADLIGRADFEKLGVDVSFTTEDGSVGTAGRVTEVLRPWLEEGNDRAEAPTVYACGPTPMMRACAEMAGEFGVRCLVSLENPMACGFGVCLGCAAPRAEGGFSLVCRAGPVFDATEIDWAGLP